MLSLWKLTPLCHKQKRNQGLVLKIIITPLWLTLTSFSPHLCFSLLHWQCYLLPIITLCSWLHILIAVCAAFINVFSCPSIQPFSHCLVFRFFCLILLFCHHRVVPFGSWCFVLHCWVTERCYVYFLAQAASPTMERAAGVDRPLVKPTIGRSVHLLCAYIGKDVCVFVGLLMFLTYFLVLKDELCCRWRTLQIYLV